MKPKMVFCGHIHTGDHRVHDLVHADGSITKLYNVARRMKLPMEKFYLNQREVGNTSSASIPLCLDKAVRDGVLKDGRRIAMAGFGSGLTWAGMLSRWPYL